MIDLHSHILPGLDDGAEDPEESLKMARMALEDGIMRVVCTPHWYPGYMENTRHEIMKAVRLFRKELLKNNLPLKIFPGAELRLDAALIEGLQSGKLMTLNDTGRFALIELPEVALPEKLEDLFWQFRLQGITPILSHPERNYALLSNPGRLRGLIKMGVLTQITGASIFGEFGKKVQEFSHYMLRYRMVHILATDAHGFRTRPLCLSRAYRAVEKMLGEEAAWQMVYETPKRIIAGEEVVPLAPIEMETPKSWSRFFFWKRR